ncbi:MAG: arylesterase [Campylobacteraceae bacterium]|nr:arylesterase [Campylobacteraceae bacterium]
MKKWIILIGIGFAAALMFMRANDKIEIPQESVILAFGDSLTQGYGASASEAYPARLGKILSMRVINGGINGEDSHQAAARLPSLLDEIKPRIVILCHGGNDILRKYDLKETKQNLSFMITLMQSKNIDVIFVGVPSGLFTDADNLYDELADEYDLIYDDSTLAKIIKTPSLKSDQIHPNAAGYDMLAQNLAKLFNDHFNIAGR